MAASTRIVSRPSRKTSTPLLMVAVVGLMRLADSAGLGVPPWAFQPSSTVVTHTPSATAVHTYRLLRWPSRLGRVAEAAPLPGSDDAVGCCGKAISLRILGWNPDFGAWISMR